MTLRFGVIGLGNRGHLVTEKYLLTNPEIEVVQVSDLNQNHFEFYKQKKINVTTDYATLLSNPEIEAVFIATPDDTHGEIILAAIKEDKHIICEKPLEINRELTRKIEKALINHNKIFLVGYVLRYATLYQKVKQLIADGVIGEILLANGIDHINYGGYAFFRDWHRIKKNSQTLLLQKSSHSLDILNWIIDSQPNQVAGLGSLSVYGRPGAEKKFGKKLTSPLNCGSCPLQNSCEESLLNLKRYKDLDWGKDWPDACVYADEIDVQDNQALLIHYENDVKLTYSICYFSSFYRREFQFFGTEGQLYFDDETNKIILHHRKTGGKKEYHFDEQIGHGGGDKAMIADFLSAIKKQSEPLANITSSATVTHLALAAQEAIDTNTIITIGGL